jgi:hypothetical protein
MWLLYCCLKIMGVTKVTELNNTLFYQRIFYGDIFYISSNPIHNHYPLNTNQNRFTYEDRRNQSA